MAQGGSVIGLLVVGNMIYKGLAPGGKVKLVALLLAVCAAVPLALSLGPEVLPRPLVVPLAVLWGLAYALPFYIPPGEFAMQIGGKSATGLFSNLFDAAGSPVSKQERWRRQRCICGCGIPLVGGRRRLLGAASRFPF